MAESADRFGSTRRAFEQLLSQTRARVGNEKQRAESELLRHMSLLRDAVDHARSVGFSWSEISARLGVDDVLLQAWLQDV